MELELKHLVGYLPYKLQLKDREEITEMCASLNYIHNDFTDEFTTIDFLCRPNQDNVKPILRPLLDLTKEIEINGEKFIPIKKLDNLGWYNMNCIKKDKVLSIPYGMVQFLLEWHFDVYGLIEQNLAININTL